MTERFTVKLLGWGISNVLTIAVAAIPDLTAPFSMHWKRLTHHLAHSTWVSQVPRQVPITQHANGHAATGGPEQGPWLCMRWGVWVGSDRRPELMVLRLPDSTSITSLITLRVH